MNRSRAMTSQTAPAQHDGSPLPAAGSRTLPDVERGLFEDRLGTDFSQVRVHTDERAAAVSEGLGAKAFTFGNEVFFAGGCYQPGTTEGRRLLAHELTHVAQQAHGPAVSHDAEARARTAADQVAQGGYPTQDAIGGAEHGVYCDDEEKKPDDITKPVTDPETSGFKLRPPFLTPPLTLGGSPQVDWLTLQQSYESRGMRKSDRDAEGIAKTWQMNSQLLSAFGITDQFKLGFITKEWILNKGIQKQVEAQQARDNPNSLDLFNKEFKQAYPGGFETPIVPIFDLDWFRSKKKK